MNNSQDMEELGRLKQVIQESRNKLQAVFDSISDPVASLTRAGNVESLNMAMARFFGQHPRDLVNHPADQLLRLADFPISVTRFIRKAWQEVLDSGAPQKNMLEIQWEGETKFLDISMVPGLQKSGEVKLVILQIKDITSLKLMEQTIRDYSQHLEEKVVERTAELTQAQARLVKEKDRLAVANAELIRLEKLRQDLTNMVIHDLKGPLAEIMGNLDLLTYESLSETQTEAVELATLGAEDLLRMIMNLLDISRMEEQRLTLKPEQVNFADLAQEVCKKFKTITRLKEMHITVRDHGAGDFEADRDLMQRVIQNFFTNALTHTSEGGEISLEAKEAEDGGVLFWVADNGQGIPESAMERIFAKFAQAGDDNRPRTSTGLGLTFCRMAVEAHGGRIWVESQLSQGAAFHVWLPRTL